MSTTALARLADPLVWYRAFVRITPREGGKTIPLLVNAAQRRYLEAVRGHSQVLVLKGRKLGITTIELAESFRLINQNKHWSGMMTAQTDPDTREIFEMAVRMHEQMPARLRQQRATSNVHELRYKARNTLLSIRTAGGKGVKRGGTIQKLHMTEVARYRGRDAEDTIAGLLEAAQAGVVRAETTAAGAHGWFYENWTDCYGKPNMPWKCLFLPWWWDEHYQVPLSAEAKAEFVLTPDEEAWAIPNAVTPEQVAWYRQKALSLKSMMRQEYPCTPEEAFIAQGNLFFDVDTLVRVSADLPPPVSVEDGGRLLVWEPYEEGVAYVIGADPTDGTPGGDPAYASVHRRDDGRQVARWHGRVVPAAFAKVLADLGHRYGFAMVAVERNHPECVRRLDTELGYHYLYRRPFGGNDPLRQGMDDRPGWVTTGQTRPLLLDHLKASLEGYDGQPGWLHIRDRVFFQEALRFEDNGRGKYEAAPDCHDDSVIAIGIALQCREQPVAGVRFM